MAIDNPFANDVVKAIKEENKKTQDKLQKAANQEVASQETLKLLVKISEGNGKAAVKAQEKLNKELAKIQDRAEAENQIKIQDDNLKENQKISGLSAKRIQKADLLAQSIAKQKEIMEEQRGKLDALGIDTATNKQFQKEELKLAKMERAQAKATKSSDAEDEADKKIADAKQNTFLGKISSGILGLGKNVVDKTKEGAGDIMGMLKKFAFGAFAVAVLAFLRSPYFDKFLKVVKEQIVPALTTLIDDYIIPVAKVIWEGIVKTWENIKELFSGLKESFELFGEGKWVQGIIKFFSTIVTFVLKQIDVAATALFNTIATVFGFEGTDSVAGSIGQFFTDIYNNVKNYILGMITSVSTKVSNFVEGVKGSFNEFIDEVKTFFKIDFMAFLESFGIGGNLIDIVYAPINLAINAVKKIFGFGDPDEPFRLSEFISNAFKKIMNFFKNLLDFDLKSLIMKLPGAELISKIGSGISSIFGGGDGKQSNTENREKMRGSTGADTGTGVGSGRSFGEDESDLEDLSRHFADPNRARRVALARARGRAENQRGGRASVAGGNYEMRMRAARMGPAADPDIVRGGAEASYAPRMKPADQKPPAPPVAPVIDAKTIDNSRGGNVTRMTRQLAPRDRITDELKKAQGF